MKRDLDELFDGRARGFFGDGLYWGIDTRHDARLWPDDEEAKLRVRIDLREPAMPLIRGLARVLTRAGLLIEDGEGLIQPAEENLVRVIRASRAAQYVVNPAEYFRCLK